MITKIFGTGSSLPATIVTNDDLSKVVDTSDEWIFSRTGIKERRLVKEENTATMSTEAAKKALEEAGITAEELDLIIVGTITADHVTPSAACEVQAALGAVNAVGFDVNAACSGFMFALHTAHMYLQCGIYKNALVIGAETLSRIMDWNDRSTCVLFGDGAGAVVVKAEEGNRGGLLAFEQCSDGQKASSLFCPGRANNNPLVKNPYDPTYVYMDGQEVYKFVASKVPTSIQRVMEKAGVTNDDIKYFVLHQANVRIIQAVSKRLKVELERFPISLDHCGNVSAGSVPILIDEMNQKGMLQAGDKIVVCGFGAGLTWATAVIEW